VFCYRQLVREKEYNIFRINSLKIRINVRLGVIDLFEIKF
jgi:hypothetical protein